MQEAQTTNGGEDNQEVSLDQIAKECLDSPGYVVFVGVMGRERDDKGNNLIRHYYRRYNYSYEDTKQAVEEFKKLYLNDVGPG